jgi:hypothetical protein
LIEADEAILREAPEEMESIASKFNSKLDDAMKNLGALENHYKELSEMESEFFSLSNTHSKAMSRLGKVAGLELKESLGKLATVSSPHGYTFSCGLELKYFVANLEAYKKKLEGFERFKQDNQNYEKNLAATREEQKEKPWQKLLDWNWLTR